MSFTLMHYKNGVPKPIKMSIWDAFKGAPSPKPAKPKPVSPDPSSISHEKLGDSVVIPNPVFPDILVECSCCHKIHQQCNPGHDNQEENPKSLNNEGQKGKSGASGGEPNHSHSTKEEESYSEEDDKIIIGMKIAGKSWQEILSAINKTSKSQVQQHWKKINPATQNPDSGGKDHNDAKDITEVASTTRKEGIEDKKADGQAKKKQKQEENKKAGKQDAKKNKQAEGKESGMLQSWSDRYDRQKWIAAASKHFDLTGQRITPAIAKKLAEG